MSTFQPLEPLTPANEKLQANVHPVDWVNPRPASKYNLVVVGAGTAGLVAAAGAAGLGAKVALVERELMGGDCLNVGCVPSKGLIAAARTIDDLRRASNFGIQILGDTRPNFSEAMERMRSLRAVISHNDSATRFKRLGVDVFFGQAKFTGRNSVDVGDARLHFKRAIIATGARAKVPPIHGLREAGYLTNESVFSLTELPRQLIILGAGPIGVELAQCFARFGSSVTVVERGPGILSREEPDAAAIVQRSLENDGVRFVLGSTVKRVERRGQERVIILEQQGRQSELSGDQILVALGRAPNVDDLGLDAAGVHYDIEHGVQVDDYLRSTNSAIFAAGDICSRFKFTHAADFLARTAIRNALFMGRQKASSLVIPWCTYTSPELARVGLTAREAQDQGIPIDTFEQDLSKVDRPMLEGESGLLRTHVKKESDKIIGATIVASTAGDLIGEIALAMTNRLGLSRIGSTIHPYPTRAEAIRKLGDQYNRTRLTPFVKSLFAHWLNWTR